MRWSWWALGNRPAVFPVSALLAGAAFASETEAPWWLFLAGAACGVVAALARRGQSFGRTAMLVACSATGGTFARLGQVDELPESRAVVIEAELESVRRVESGVQLLAQIARIDGHPTRLRAQLFSAGPAHAFEVGERVQLETKLKPVVPTSNPGEWNGFRRALLRGQPVTGSFDAARVVRLAEAPRWRQWLRRTHERLAAATRAQAPDDASAALFLTLSAGLRASLDEQVEEDFARSGLAHVLSVSGLHVAVLAFALFAVLRWLAIRLPGRFFRRTDPRGVAAPLALPVTWAYVVFTGLQAPAVRSGLMCTVLLLGHSMRRRSDGLNALAIAAAVMIALDPSAICDLSLQLSFTAVLALLLLTPTLRALVPVPVPSGARATGGWLHVWRWGEAALSTALASVAVTLVSAPLIAMTFQRLGVAGLASNVVAMPVSAALTLLAAGSAATFVVSPSLAEPLLWVGTRLSALLLELAQWFAALPFASVEVAGPTMLVAVLWWLGLAAFVLTHGRWRWVGLATPLAAAIHLVPVESALVEVTFLAVGHGDATVVSHAGHHVLIDGGGVPNGTDTGKRFVLPFLRTRHIERLDLAVLSHAHPDHALGLITTLEQVPTERLWLPPSPAGPLLTDVMEAADRAEIEVIERGHEGLRLGALTIEVLGPPGDRSLIENENDRSIVLKLTHGDVSFLLTGDLEETGEALLGPTGAVTVVKAPHHGSDTSSTPGFVEATRAKHVVFCVGRNNRFDFPRAEVVDRWQRAGARCHRTDRDGAITFRSDGRDVAVESFGPRALGHGRRSR